MAKKSLTLNEFIKRSIEKHGSLYDYSKVVYTNLETKICIICPIHREYFTTPATHLKGSICPKCNQSNLNNKKRLTKEIFIKRAITRHGLGKYDYSEVIHKNASTKVCIICKVHGKFFQLPFEHLNGRGCKKCDVNNRRLSLAKFISRAISVHGIGKYDYSKVQQARNLKDKVCIVCPIHEDFWQTAADHLNGFNCPSCGFLSTANHLTSNTDEFIRKAKAIHGNRYDYSYVDYSRSNKKVSIFCKIHGGFHQKPNWHLMGRGCPRCKMSKGEIAIGKWLSEKNIDFKPQYSFKDLVGCGKNPLIFDFFIPHKNLVIEFDGEQHFRPICFNGISLEKAESNFEKLKHNDVLKNNYCKNNSTPLLRIPYTEAKRIPEILTRTIYEAHRG